MTVRQRELVGIDMTAERRAWARERAEILRPHPPCAAGRLLEQHLDTHRCLRIATEVHHRRRAGRQGNLRAPANHVLCCSRCHRAIHRNTALAHDLGLLAFEHDADWDDLGYRP